VVIGGIFVQDERTEEQKVPYLADIPVLGNLFKNTSRKADRSELLIFLTPKVVSEKAALR
jgi:type IV pilus assembly protein PilQ